MSVNDLVDRIEILARAALLQAKAITVCELHPDSTITIMDSDAESHAYALATNTLKRDDEMFLREDVMAAIKSELADANDECPQCTHYRDD